ncbi:MAG: hypothetical protein P8X64_14145 [Anaerolineales bacterium]|jgi:hypothetical protein
MDQQHTLRTLAVPLLLGLILFTCALSSAPTTEVNRNLDATPTPAVASPEQLAAAEADWLESSHSDTYDMGVGANTTCARCKSPTNWDPQAPGAELSLDCYSCKHVPGEPRPELVGGDPVPQADWNNITCEICHEPVGDSYSTGIAFWDQLSETYQPVESVMELCAHCHEGQHGFKVIEEQRESPIHTGWECTDCHGAHGSPSSCTDCHDPEQGPGATEHARHPDVNCTACHDAGGLTIHRESDPSSKYYGIYIPVRFAHSLTSWPSHDLTTEIECIRCHHPGPTGKSPVDVSTGCSACHPDGAMWIWCSNFIRDQNPVPYNDEYGQGEE